jgi:hypothetical protein
VRGSIVVGAWKRKNPKSKAKVDHLKAPTCTTTIISLKPCALNAEFQRFILMICSISY